MARPGRYFPIDRAQLIDLYVEQGLTLAQVGHKLGLSPFTVSRRMLEHGIPIRRRGTRPEHAERHQQPAKVLNRRLLVERYPKQRMAMTVVCHEHCSMLRVVLPQALDHPVASRWTT